MWVPGGFAYLIAGGWYGFRLFVDAPVLTSSGLK